MADSKRNAKRWVKLIFSQRHDLFAAEVHFKNHVSQFLQQTDNQLRDIFYRQLKKQNKL